MSNILKPSAYPINMRDGVTADYGDYIKIFREIAPEPGEDPTSVKWVVSFWIDCSSLPKTSASQQLILNWGDKFFVYVLTDGLGSFQIKGGHWKQDFGEYAFEFWKTNDIALTSSWEMWSFVIRDPYDSGEEGMLFYRNGDAVASPKTARPGTPVSSSPSPWWTISSIGMTQDLVGGPLPSYTREPFFSTISDFSIFVKESIDFEAVITFLWNSGRGKNAHEYDTQTTGDRLEVDLPLRDGVVFTRTPSKGRRFYDAEGLVAEYVLGDNPTFVSRTRDVPCAGRREQSMREKYLSHTRSNDKFVHRAVPEFEHQYSWVKRSVPISDLPDAEGI